jgi:hypothetical protein
VVFDDTVEAMINNWCYAHEGSQKEAFLGGGRGIKSRLWRPNEIESRFAKYFLLGLTARLSEVS